jgi:hypothetical protein
MSCAFIGHLSRRFHARCTSRARCGKEKAPIGVSPVRELRPIMMSLLGHGGGEDSGIVANKGSEPIDQPGEMLSPVHRACAQKAVRMRNYRHRSCQRPLLYHYTTLIRATKSNVLRLSQTAKMLGLLIDDRFSRSYSTPRELNRGSTGSTA